MAVPKSRPAGRRRSFREAAAADFREADQAAAVIRAEEEEGRRLSFREVAVAVIRAEADQRAAVHARAIS